MVVVVGAEGLTVIQKVSKDVARWRAAVRQCWELLVAASGAAWG